jgi:hypothetical protein
MAASRIATATGLRNLCPTRPSTLDALAIA